MSTARAIVVAGALIAIALFAGSGVWRAEAQQNSERRVEAVVSGELIWWLENTARGPQVSVCAFDGREIDCQSKGLDR